ncbi:MAG: hypothetical protein WBF05_05225 [Anaerolineales bacterium]
MSITQFAVSPVGDPRGCGGVCLAQIQGAVSARVCAAAIQRLDVPGAAVVMSILQVLLGDVRVVIHVTYVSVTRVDRQGGVPSHIPGTVDRLRVWQTEGVLVCILQVAVGEVIVANVGLVTNQNQRGVPSNVSSGGCPLDVPVIPIVPGILQVVAGRTRRAST